MVSKSNPIVIEEVKDPKELAAARAQRERFDRNAAWLQTHLADIYSTHRGKVICVAGVVFYIESRRFLIRDSPRPATTYEQKTGGADGVKGA